MNGVGFCCAFCGLFTPWRWLGGWTGRLRFCDDCVNIMDHIELGAE